MSQPKLSQLAETLIGSEIVKLGNMISERIRAGETIYNFTIGDFDPKVFPIPFELESEIIASYQQHNTNYPAAEGVLDLRKSVSAFLKEWEGIDYAPNEIQIASGGRPLIYTIFKAIVDKGDKVIYGVPSWNNNHYVHLTDGEHCVIECSVENDFMPTVDDVAKNIKGATLLCLCTPQNPTGTTLSKASLEAICDLVLAENATRGEGEKKLYLMFDQMYWTLTYGTTEHYNPITLRPAMKKFTVFVDGISKVFAATGVRVGWALGPETVIAKMKAILSHLGAWAPMAEQKAVAKYLLQKEAIEQYLQHFKMEVEFRLRSIYDGFMALKFKGFSVDAVAPQAAIYLTIKIDLVGKTTADGTLLATQMDVTSYILAEAKLAVVPFSAFGGGANNPWYRLSVGTSKKEEIPQMLAKLEKALEKLK
ncbi:MAG: aminotransferase [Bacteroidetes bacterium 24-39-8]|jgi:aspartate aminotransferase|nr:MAG: aminotransferase [Sphingobacteriia bacterium 35-40-8]OYZ51005.1 MAG: aminotransferase [Bacteroidetes bacterium 24-39-8]OZA69199.1 MAG: aminotransferase [Sphingobacteriia bacterium 39-39-8]HQR93274.1 aminotransferase class I/II-fold pyridoxal phosphate-dependent enzyme [Sediminibacterium sp.]HQS54521.1 aminotransferase class I/II-fold pyridoxal phosphate-dependent enzyme [Sediminibacterium sp.]